MVFEEPTLKPNATHLLFLKQPVFLSYLETNKPGSLHYLPIKGHLFSLLSWTNTHNVGSFPLRPCPTTACGQAPSQLHQSARKCTTHYWCHQHHGCHSDWNYSFACCHPFSNSPISPTMVATRPLHGLDYTHVLPYPPQALNRRHGSRHAPQDLSPRPGC
jgi:hypothetical protein